MPKRTNDFQRLIYLVRTNLDAGAEVKESQMLKDRFSKRKREVDIVIRGKVGAQPVVVCIECRDHKRVADITWIDTMKSKHERLETNVLLLASSSGFTKEAIEIANKYGIELFTLENQDSPDIPNMLGPTGTLWHKSFTLTVTAAKIRVEEIGGFASETVATMPDNYLYDRDGKELGTVKNLSDELLGSDTVQQRFLHDGEEEHNGFHIIWEPPEDLLGHSIYLKKLEPSVLRKVESIQLFGSCKFAIGKFGFRYGKIGNHQIAWAKADVAGLNTMAVATTDCGGQTYISFNIEGRPDINPKRLSTNNQ